MCGRCQSIMHYDTMFQQWRCILCGNREDAVIRQNRIDPPKPDRPAAWATKSYENIQEEGLTPCALCGELTHNKKYCSRKCAGAINGNIAANATRGRKHALSQMPI